MERKIWEVIASIEAATVKDDLSNLTKERLAQVLFETYEALLDIVY